MSDVSGVPAVPEGENEEPRDGAGQYSIGSQTWPGLSKLNEECGEVIQVIGKLMGVGGAIEHWDGPLDVRLEDELGDLTAALRYVRAHNGKVRLDYDRIDARADAKFLLFQTWDAEAKS